MRELKFKAFYKPTKTMYWFDVMNGNHGHGNGYVGMAPFGEDIDKPNGGYRSNMILVDPTDCELMQFTGLKDTNGKEIYEGDIVNLKTNYHTQSKKFGWQNVEIFYDYTSFKCRNKEGHVYDLDEETDESSYSWDVVGNIYENPELLK